MFIKGAVENHRLRDSFYKSKNSMNFSNSLKSNNFSINFDFNSKSVKEIDKEMESDYSYSKIKEDNYIHKKPKRKGNENNVNLTYTNLNKFEQLLSQI